MSDRIIMAGDLLPARGIPPTPGFAGELVEWIDMDTRERYRRAGGHPLYGETDIQYRFNSLGYRCPEFDETAELRIIAVGCSYVLGVGLPEEALFHHRFAERFRRAGRSVIVWNLGASGVSNDYIQRTVYFAVRRLDPHIILVNFTHSGRREYVSVEDRPVPYDPGWAPDDLVAGTRHFDALSSAFDDRLNPFSATTPW